MLVIIGFLISYELPFAQSQFIDFYGKRVTIGMTKTKVKNLFAESYDIEEKNNFFMLYSKKIKSLDGSFGFENNKLYVANRYWGIYQYENSMEFTEVLYTLLSKIQKEGLKIAEVSTNIQNEPNSTYKTIKIDFGDKDISIKIIDTREYVGVEIVESLFRFPQ